MPSQDPIPPPPPPRNHLDQPLILNPNPPVLLLPKIIVLGHSSRRPPLTLILDHLRIKSQLPQHRSLRGLDDPLNELLVLVTELEFRLGQGDLYWDFG